MIYESLLATKKIREIREIRVRLKRIILSVEHESFETKQLIRVIRAIRVRKKYVIRVQRNIYCCEA